ncbi:hypothetical protein RAS1_34170 [Phycisphaerae bacterium RAS1]|nr:hypothetical protein RAS1_34170 [Phycisphaerae bacterium RAS1]
MRAHCIRTRRVIAITCAALATVTSKAADVTWDNGSANFTWDNVSLNWSGAAWNNAAGDGAVFGASGVGAINVAMPVFADSLSFTVDGYSLAGPGSINIMAGSSTQTTGVVNVAAGATAGISAGINSALGFQKIGTGTLKLSGVNNFAGPGVPLVSNGLLRTDVLIGGSFGTLAGGTLVAENATALPSNTRVSIGNGYLDIGSNNVTLSELIFTNQNPPAPWNPILNANNGVIGSGTLRVLGDINVIGVTGNNAGNTIASNFDLGGGTQVIRMGLTSSIGLSSALMFTGSISNGSLLKTIGVTTAGVPGSIDGLGLFGNNTYAGATILNSGTSVATGTNASTSIKIAGIPAGPAGGSFSLQGANGSFQSATLIEAYAGGSFILDNNAAIGASGNNQPNIPAAQNNDRIRDDATMKLRDGTFIYRGRTTEAASETFGALDIVGGHNTFNITPNGTGGTATVTIAGDLTLGNRATLQVTGTTLSAAGKVFVNGALPAADSTDILPRIVGSSDFLSYNGTTGLTPFTGYSLDFNTPGTNVAITAASTVASSVTINALKRTGAFTTTIDAGQTLGISSGMMLNTSGTGTFSGGTIAFGSTPGVFFSGTNVINSAITGSDGLINANSTTTLAGDLSGLSGTIATYNGTTSLATNSFAGPLSVRAGTLNINTSQIGAGLGAITLGVSQNDANLVGLVPTLNFSGAGANAVIDRDIIVDNGALTSAGAALGFSTVTRLSPLSNATGSQSITGDITLYSPVNLQGGGGSGSGSTNFTGDVSGPSRFIIPNGRAAFSGSVSNDGGFLIGNSGFTAQVTFTGTGSGSGPITLLGGNSSFVRYENGALPGGTITTRIGSGVPSLIPLENSTLNNTISIQGDTIANVGAGITAEWAGPLTGGSLLTKTGDGVLFMSSGSSTHGGTIDVTTGTLRVDGLLPSTIIAVAGGAVLEGTGTASGNIVVSSGGTISPGSSIGVFNTGGLTLAGTLRAEVDLNNGGAPQADLLEVTGTVTVASAVLNLLLSDLPAYIVNESYLLVANDGADAVIGAFGSIIGLPGGYFATIDYAFAGTDSLGRTGDGNDIAVLLTPEPSSLLLLGAAGAMCVMRRRR